MLIGAGEAGVMVAKEITARPDLGIVPVGFVDDDTMKMGCGSSAIMSPPLLSDYVPPLPKQGNEVHERKRVAKAGCVGARGGG